MNQNTLLNEKLVRIRVTINRIRGMAKALESECDRLMTKNPKLFALLSEAPIDLIDRMCDELNELLEPLKHDSAASTSTTSLIDNSISTPSSPGPIESAS
jgi:hypothetical protein